MVEKRYRFRGSRASKTLRGGLPEDETQEKRGYTYDFERKDDERKKTRPLKEKRTLIFSGEGVGTAARV